MATQREMRSLIFNIEMDYGITLNNYQTIAKFKDVDPDTLQLKVDKKDAKEAKTWNDYVDIPYPDIEKLKELRLIMKELAHQSQYHKPINLKMLQELCEGLNKDELTQKTASRLRGIRWASAYVNYPYVIPDTKEPKIDKKHSKLMRRFASYLVSKHHGIKVSIDIDYENSLIHVMLDADEEGDCETHRLSAYEIINNGEDFTPKGEFF